MDLSDLIARLESATEGSRELDVKIAHVVSLNVRWSEFHKDWLYCIDPKDTPQRAFMALPAFTASLDAALTLVPEGMTWRIHPCEAVVGKDQGAISGGEHKWSYGETPALALCISALRARQASQSRKGV